jgi:hydrogenase-4 component F
MTAQNTSMDSILPAIAFLLPVLSGTLVILGKVLGRRFWQGLTVLTSAAVAGIGVWMAYYASRGMVLTTWGKELRVDALSALLVAAIGNIGLLASVYSVRYIMQPILLDRLGTDVAERRLRIFYGLLLWLLGTMVWGCVTNNIIMLYVAVEATTLTSGFLVAFYWDRHALEAGYKYLMLLTIGITFALFGCVLIYTSAVATKQLAGMNALLISEMRNVVHLMPSGTAAIAIAFLVIGFGTKAGIAPFHPWLPDAYAEAPTPVCVLLSAVMSKMALYAMARTVSIFYPLWPQLTIFAVSLGAFTMVFGIVTALTQDDLKRLLAYSSVSQIGYVLVGIGLGTYLGCYGGLFHLVNHAIYKALLFMCIGAVIYATGGVRRISELGGLAIKMPVTSVCFFLGALSIAGFPPMNGFWSKFTVYLSLAEAGLWWAAAIAVLTSIMTMVVLVRAASAVFWGTGRPDGYAIGQVREAPASMLAPMVILAASCLALGIFPQAIYPLLDKAATVLATIGR